MELLESKPSLTHSEICTSMLTFNPDLAPDFEGNEEQRNHELEKSVKDALLWAKGVPQKGIEVFVEDGRVILTGEAQSWKQKKAATLAVESIQGVVEVANQIIVSPGVQPSEVKNRIRNTFLEVAEIDAEKIEVEIKKDEAILLGYVRSFAEKMDAEYAARATPGINRVFNYLRVID